MHKKIFSFAFLLTVAALTIRLGNAQALSDLDKDPQVISIKKDLEFTQTTSTEPTPPLTGWTVLSDSNKPVGPGIVWLRIKISGKDIKDPTIFIEFAYGNIEVFVNNQIIYKYGDATAVDFRNTYSYTAHFIELDTIPDDRYVYIRNSNFEKRIGILDAYYGNRTDLLIQSAKENALFMTTGIIAATLSFCSLILFSFRRSGHEFLYFTIFSLCLASHIILSTPLINGVLLHSAEAINLLGRLGFLGMISSITAFSFFLISTYKLNSYGFIAQIRNFWLLFLCVVTAADISGYAYIGVFSNFLNYLVILGATNLLVAAWLIHFYYKNQIIRSTLSPLFIGIGILLTAVFFDILQSKQVISLHISFISLGILAFLTSLVFILAKRFSAVFESSIIQAEQGARLQAQLEGAKKNVMLMRNFEEAQQIAKIGSWSLDVETQSIKWSNQMFELFATLPDFGVPSFEEHLAMIHPDDQENWRNTFEKCQADGEAYSIRLRSVFPDKVLWLDARGEGKRNASGRLVQLSGNYQDVTKLVDAEKRLAEERHKAIRNSKLASLGEMAAGIAHEINNPLAIISGISNHLHRYASDQEKFSKKIDDLKKSSDRIRKIVNGLRKYARNNQRKEYQIHNAAEVIKEALTLTQARLVQYSTQLEFEAQSEAQIYCDEVEIEQVIINLICNSIDAVKDLDERWVQIKLFDEHDMVILQVRDSGRGLHENIGDKLFEPFFTTKPVGEGTGLGLSITKGILDDHKATIELLKDDPHTCFEIRFKSEKRKNYAS